MYQFSVFQLALFAPGGGGGNTGFLMVSQVTKGVSALDPIAVWVRRQRQSARGVSKQTPQMSTSSHGKFQCSSW